VKNSRFAFKVTGLIFRGFLLVVLFSLVCALGVFFALPRLMSGAQARNILTAALARRLHRPVSINAVLSTLSGLKIEGLVVGGSKEEDKGPFLQARSVLIDLNLKHLLNKKIEIGEMRFINPSLRLRRGAGGEWNFSSMLSSEIPIAGGFSFLGNIPISISMGHSGIVIEDGKLQVEDQISSTSLKISLLNASFKPLDFSRPALLHLNFASQGRLLGHPADLSLSFQGIADLASFDLNRAFLRAEKFNLSFSSYNVSGSWRLVGFKEPSLEASLNFPALGPSDWSGLLKRSWNFHLPASSLKVNMGMSGKGVIQINNLAIRAQPLRLDATGAILISNLQPQGNFVLNLHDFPLSSAANFSPRLKVYHLRGGVRASADLSGTLDRPILKSVRLEAKDISARVFGARTRSEKFFFHSSDSFQRMAIRASGAEIRVFSSTFSKLSGDVLLLKKKDLHVKALNFAWSGSHFRVKGRVFPLPKPRIVAVAGTINKLSYDQVENFLAQMKSVGAVSAPTLEEDAWQKKWVESFKKFIPKKFPNTMGHIRIGEIVQGDFSAKNADFLWTIRGVTPDLTHISGEAGLSLGSGEVKDIETLQNSHKFLKIIFLPYVYMHKMNSLSVLSAAEAYPKTLNFNRIEGEYGIREGIITTRFSYLNGPDLVAYATGKADFAKEKIDMSVLTRLTHYRAPLPEWWVDELGRPAIGFRVTGNLNHPDAEPRLSKIKADEIEKDVKLGRQEEKSRFRTLRRLRFL